MPASNNSKSKEDGFPHVDYALARRRILHDFKNGVLTTLDVCDANPELLRVATNHGTPTNKDCPICSDMDTKNLLVEVSYLYGGKLGKGNGRPVTEYNQLEDADKKGKTFHRYLVEVCTNCKWNFLVRREDHN